MIREILENVEIKVKSKMQRRKIGTSFSKEVKPISVKEDKSKYCLRESTAKRTSFEKLLLKRCSHFTLYTPHAVNCILNLKIRKSISEHELKGPLGTFLLQIMKQKTEKLKEFLAKVEAHYRKNEQMKFHHKPKVNDGTFDASTNQMIEIKTQREQAWNNYKDLTTTSGKYIFEQEKPKKIRQRILRVSQKYPNTTSTSFRKEESFFHYCKILPFLQTARKIVLRNRLLNVLLKLQGLTPESISQFEEPFIGNYSLTSQT
ncbi:unnamed protein product [Heterotrigona itama]|uniref:Uncharacterized protein n=1 Tax=Heterotrigona itama TaxID=395501 RepID=A0A6V7H7V6_9HYME|nr:unnamed protein product [Heterotrigona itama]